MEVSVVRRPARKRAQPERLTVLAYVEKPRKKVEPNDNRCAPESRPPNCPHTSPTTQRAHKMCSTAP